jgi:NAD(P) transhydrogenase subunit alpha
MDALSSQANVGGYKAVLIAAEAYPRYFPLLTTAAGTAKPAKVLILGIGVAGLQAIATARRLGAQVQAYDVRSETREQAESLGAKFLELKSVADASGSGGYARELTAEERAAQQAELNGYIGDMDVVITTAQVPGRRPPVLVTAAAVALMKPGSVIVDMAASALGGNCEVSQPDQTIVTDNGVKIIAPTNIPATMPAGAATFYARNISALLTHFVKDGAMNYDFSDEITAATVITYRGEVVHAPTAKLLGQEPAAAPAPAPAPVPAAPAVIEAPAPAPASEPVIEAPAPVAEVEVVEVEVVETAAEAAETVVAEAPAAEEVTAQAETSDKPDTTSGGAA